MIDHGVFSVDATRPPSWADEWTLGYPSFLYYHRRLSINVAKPMKSSSNERSSNGRGSRTLFRSIPKVPIRYNEGWITYASFFIHLIISIYYTAWVQTCNTQKNLILCSTLSSLNSIDHLIFYKGKRGKTHSIGLPSWGGSLFSTTRWRANQPYVCWTWKGAKRTLRTCWESSSGGFFLSIQQWNFV